MLDLYMSFCTMVASLMFVFLGAVAIIGLLDVGFKRISPIVKIVKKHRAKKEA